MPISRILLRPWLVTTLAALILALAVVATAGDALALVTIGTRFSTGNPAGTEGYDGQFVYFIARDPETAPRFIAQGGDIPAYRFQRILLPLAGRALALGQEALIPWALLTVNLVALAAGTAVLEALLRAEGVSRWYALGYGLSLVGVGCVRLSLTEPLAYGLALAGVYYGQRQRWITSAVAFGLAGLAKETTLIMAAGYGVYLVWQFISSQQVASLRRHLIETTTFAVIGLAPFVLLQGVLYTRLGAFGVGSGGNLATSFEVVPFLGVLRILTEGSPLVFVVFMLILGPFVLLPTLWGLYRCARDVQQGEITAYTCLLFTTAAIMPFVPFSTYREPLGILRFIAGLQIAVIVYAAERRMRRPLRYSLLWALGTLFVVSADFG